MTSLQFKQTSFEKVIVAIIFAELILGGSGRVIMIGPISLRIVCLIGLICFFCYLLYRNRIVANASNMLLICILFDFAAMLAYSLLNNTVSSVVDCFSGYIVLAVCPVFVFLFSKNTELVFLIRKEFYYCCLCVSFLTFILWLLSFFINMSPILNSVQYGGMAYIGPIPRLFLKSSIFVCCGIFFAIADYITTKKAKYFILAVIYSAAVGVTFTTSFYVFTVVLVLVAYYNLVGRDHFIRFLAIILSFAIILFLLVYKMGIIGLFMERFSGDYNFSYKGIQVKTVIDSVLQSPLFGHGFGYTIKIDYGYKVSNVYSFEVMWAQLLLDTGIIGFSLFSAHVLLTIYNLHRLFKRTQKTVFLAFELSVIMICLVSFTNPFMNNAIGLLFYAIAVGISCIDPAKAKEEKDSWKSL